jgi:hypothetical protein
MILGFRCALRCILVTLVLCHESAFSQSLGHTEWQEKNRPSKVSLFLAKIE